jgi:putative iron-only hydrogenase system regulator
MVASGTSAEGSARENKEDRIALIGIIVREASSVERLNRILHDHRASIIGRMGIPYSEKGVSVLSLVVDAPLDVISALAGKLGMLAGASSKTVFLS